MERNQLSAEDSLIYLLQNKIATLPISPINIQAYAQNILDTYNEEAVTYASARVLTEDNVNTFNVYVEYGWSFTFTSAQVKQFMNETVEQDGGLITPMNMSNTINLTSTITVYLNSDFFLIFFLDDGEAQLSNFIGPGLINDFESNYLCGGIAGSWSKTPGN